MNLSFEGSRYEDRDELDEVVGNDCVVLAVVSAFSLPGLRLTLCLGTLLLLKYRCICICDSFRKEAEVGMLATVMSTHLSKRESMQMSPS